MTRYRVSVEQNPDYWKGHYRAVAYEISEGGYWNPIRILGDEMLEEIAEWHAMSLRTRYGLEGSIIVSRGGSTTVVHGKDNNSMLHWLFEAKDNKIVEWWLKHNEYQLVERSKDATEHPDTHFLCGKYKKL